MNIIDARLLGSVAMFGIGWGRAGYCPGPGPALAPLAGLSPLTLVFVAMVLGWWLDARPPAPRS